MHLPANNADVEIAVTSKRRRGAELEDTALGSDKFWRRWAPPQQ
jgi:hypothetical protein